MGLDMYLFSTSKDNVVFVKGTNLVSDVLEFKKLNEVGYWRKANQIHNWFVKNVQNNKDNCELYSVSKEKLLELKDVCYKVIEGYNLEEKLLPTIGGFFFGSIDYDEYYYDYIRETIKIIDDILNTIDFDKNFILYNSSW
jgi:hypothetical protein